MSNKHTTSNVGNPNRGTLNVAGPLCRRKGNENEPNTPNLLVALTFPNINGCYIA